ncbi:hypothetical protein YC2023_001987 [Brassica napus]
MYYGETEVLYWGGTRQLDTIVDKLTRVPDYYCSTSLKNRRGSKATSVHHVYDRRTILRTRVKRESSPPPEEPRRSSAIGGDKSVKDQLSSLHRRPRRNRIITSGKITAVYNQSNHCDRGTNRESVVDRRTGSNNQTKPEELR